jgi:mono/diheme cytochrome c family protein
VEARAGDRPRPDSNSIRETPDGIVLLGITEEDADMRFWVIAVLGLSSAPAGAAEKTAAERGKEALLTRSFAPPVLSRGQFDQLWKVWGLRARPADFDGRLRDRYGLHRPGYPNDGLPMGLRPASGLLGGRGVGNDCMLCHASSLFGKTVIGMPNSALDLQTLFDELAEAQGFKQTLPIPFSNVRGTTEAVASAAYLFRFRNPDLTMRPPVKLSHTTTACEDVPAWWLLKKKQSMYATGSHSAQSVRSLMSFLLPPPNTAQYIKRQEPTFRDIREYLLTLEAPKYPFAIDAKQAARGKTIFENNCAKCHGTYGPGGDYPNKVVSLDRIGTDRTLAEGFPEESARMYNRSWFGQEPGPDGKPMQGRRRHGYQAPPLDGVWATAPYLHNGSVPTLAHVLNSKARPAIFTRSYRTEKEDYDAVNVGWKVTVLKEAPRAKLSGQEKRKIYDTSLPGRANTGHTFGDKLTDDERRAVIEYLKTL